MTTDTPTFTRVAIVNRGEPAMRFIAAAREVTNLGGAPVTSIALYTDPDSGAMFVREADEAYHLGPAASYLDYEALERALVACRAEAVWVGWGFVAEHPGFVDLCDRLGIVFIGPSADSMRKLGDKINSKRLAEEAKVPVAPWSGGAVESHEAAREWGDKLGYPVMIKATAGGGGRGIRKVRSAEEMADAFTDAAAEATKAFGNGTMFIEKMMVGARHVEVQVIADGQGDVWALGVRDCTVQRRNQKIVEETPCPALSDEQHRELEEAAARLVRTIGYRNAGTIEFLYDPKSESFSFMEVNARLQVEHPITEVITGADLVRLQIHVARGGALPEVAPTKRGHAIEVRLNAEDPDDGFAPAPGTIEYLRLPHGPGIRIDTGVAEGDTIAAEFDSMIGKIIAWGANREEAIARLRRALVETSVVVRGGTTNKGFLLELLGRPEIATSEVDVGWMDKQVEAGTHVSGANAEVALMVAAIDAYDAELALEQARFFASAARGRPEVSDEVGRELELSYRGNNYKLTVSRLATDRYRVDVGGQRVDLAVADLRDGERWVNINDRRYRVLSVDQGLSLLVEVDGTPHRISRDRGGLVRAPSPAIVVSLLVSAGDEVAAGDRLAVLEAMKMEMPVVAQFSGRVKEVMVVGGVQVEPGAPLLSIESAGDVEVEATERLDLTHLNTGEGAGSLVELRSLVLGYDGSE
ncbi:MAG: ATP-grasp domain-containing protein, partial [Deltaproteobacteria bacterium]|nr:ATP-grasp domain-containing protein [Deltaproteobacteria bacterium]